MERWLVQLEGAQFDLEEFPKAYTMGDLQAVQLGDRFYLVGSVFEQFASSEQVYAEANRRLPQLAGALQLTQPNLRAPTIGHVLREHDDGRRDVFVFVAGVEARAKAGAIGVALVDGVPQPPTSHPAQRLFTAANQHDRLSTALALWPDAQSWPRLYRVLEEIERYLQKPINRAGLASDNQRDRFTQSANAAEVAGRDSRHAQGHAKPPRKPMTVTEARRFIGGVLEQAIRGAERDIERQSTFGGADH
jgi:hypothetical protein